MVEVVEWEMVVFSDAADQGTIESAKFETTRRLFFPLNNRNVHPTT